MRTQFLILACALLPLATEAAAKVDLPQTGLASWYGNEFKGRKTASGERYDPEQLTAAHRKLPFGTMVKVTNLRNDRSVIVRITNRGPYSKNRIIDVSRAAARELDMIHRGVVRVRIEAVKPSDSGSHPPG
jgi:rare lipoprotein A